MESFKKIKEKIGDFLEKDPKKTFLGMVIIIVLSIVIVFFMQSRKPEKTYQEVIEEISRTPEEQKTIDNKSMPSLIDLGSNILRIKEIERSLDSLNRKQELTTDDSIQARILLHELRNLLNK